MQGDVYWLVSYCFREVIVSAQLYTLYSVIQGNRRVCSLCVWVLLFPLFYYVKQFLFGRVGYEYDTFGSVCADVEYHFHCNCSLRGTCVSFFCGVTDFCVVYITFLCLDRGLLSVASSLNGVSGASS